MLPLSVHYSGSGEEDDGKMMERRTGATVRERKSWGEKKSRKEVDIKISKEGKMIYLWFREQG